MNFVGWYYFVFCLTRWWLGWWWCCLDARLTNEVIVLYYTPIQVHNIIGAQLIDEWHSIGVAETKKNGPHNHNRRACRNVSPKVLNEEFGVHNISALNATFIGAKHKITIDWRMATGEFSCIVRQHSVCFMRWILINVSFVCVCFYAPSSALQWIRLIYMWSSKIKIIMWWTDYDYVHCC